MKFDPFKWNEVKPNEEFEIPPGRLCVMSSEIAKVYVTAEGYEVLAGVGYKVEITTKAKMTAKIDAPKGARCFYESPPAVNYSPKGEVFSNADRKPLESGTVLEVTKALRQFRLERQVIMGELKAEQRKLLALREERAPKRRKARDAEDPEEDVDDEQDVSADAAE